MSNLSSAGNLSVSGNLSCAGNVNISGQSTSSADGYFTFPIKYTKLEFYIHLKI